MKGYDEMNTILLPPRNPGDKLPQELLDYYDEQMKRLEEQERLRKIAEEEEAARRAALAAEEAERLAAEEALAGEERGETGEEAAKVEDGSAAGDASINIPVPVSATSHGSNQEPTAGTAASVGGAPVVPKLASQSPSLVKPDATEKAPDVVDEGKL